MLGFKYLQSECIYWSKEIPEESCLFKSPFVRKWSKLAKNHALEMVCKSAFQFLNVLNIPASDLVKCRGAFNVLPMPVLCGIMEVADATVDYYYKIWDDLPNEIRETVFEKMTKRLLGCHSSYTDKNLPIYIDLLKKGWRDWLTKKSLYHELMHVLLTRSILQNENELFRTLINEKEIKESSVIDTLCYFSIERGNLEAFETCVKMIESPDENFISSVRKSFDILISKASKETLIGFLPFILIFHKKEIVLDILQQKGSNHILEAILRFSGYKAGLKKEGDTALHLSQSNNEARDIALFETLLKLGENPNQKNDYGETPLACQIPRCKDGGEILVLLRLFKAYGAEFKDGDQLLLYLCQSKLEGRGAPIRFLLENCQEIDRYNAEFINAAVTRYCPGPDIDEVIEALLGNGFSLNKINNEKLIFYLACRHGCLDILKHWESRLPYEFNPNAFQKGKQTSPARAAIEMGHLEVLDFLVDKTRKQCLFLEGHLDAAITIKKPELRKKMVRKVFEMLDRPNKVDYEAIAQLKELGDPDLYDELVSKIKGSKGTIRGFDKNFFMENFECKNAIQEVTISTSKTQIAPLKKPLEKDKSLDFEILAKMYGFSKVDLFTTMKIAYQTNRLILELIMVRLAEDVEGVKCIARMRETCADLKTIIDDIIMRSNIFRSSFAGRPNELRAFYRQTESVPRLHEIFFRKLNIQAFKYSLENDVLIAKSITDTIENAFKSVSEKVHVNALQTDNPHFNLCEYSTSGFTTLHLACAYNGTIPVIKTLLKHKADVNQPCAILGSTPLCFAVQEGKIELINKLLKRGAWIEGVSWSKKTPLLWARDLIFDEDPKEKALPTIRLLLEKGANLLASDEKGNTLLHYAAEAGNIEVLLELIRVWNFPLNIKNHFGRTPLTLSKNLDTLKLFLNLGCQVNPKSNDFYDKIFIEAIRSLESDDWESFLHFICRNIKKFQKYPFYYIPIIKNIIKQDKVQVRLENYQLEVNTLKHEMSHEAFKILNLLARGITTLKIRYNEMAHPYRFPRLQELHFHSSLGHYLNDKDLEKLARLTHLKKLYLYNVIENLKGNAFEKFNQVSFLCLMSNDLYKSTSISEELILNVKKIKYLTHLRLVNLTFTNEDSWLHLCEFHELRELALNCTTITDEALHHLSKHPNLKAIRLLDNCKMTEKGIEALRMMRNIKSLDISFNPHIPNEIVESVPISGDDILNLIWKTIHSDEKQKFYQHCSEKHEFKFPAFIDEVSDIKLLDIALWIVCQGNMHRSLKQLLKLAKGELVLSQKKLNNLLKTSLDAKCQPSIIRLLMDAGARIVN